MNKYSLSIYWSDRDSSFIALSPEFPGMSAFGDSQKEALEEANLAINGMKEFAEDNGEAVPAPKIFPDASGQFRVRVPRSLHVALSLEAERQGVSLNSLVQNYLTAGILCSSAADYIERFLGKKENSLTIKIAFKLRKETWCNNEDNYLESIQNIEQATETPQYVHQLGA